MAKAAKKTSKSAVVKKAVSKAVKKTVQKIAAKALAKPGAEQKAAKGAGATPSKAPSKEAPARYKLNVGDSAPNEKVTATSGRQFKLSELRGKKVVLYFYPKDNTPGCTLEGHDFRKLHSKFLKQNCEILGVSMDSLKSHESFKSKCEFPFELISDESGALCRAFDVIQMKNMYGRKFEGIERSTFAIDEKGKVAAVWRKVRVSGHAENVLDAISR